MVVVVSLAGVTVAVFDVEYVETLDAVVVTVVTAVA